MLVLRRRISLHDLDPPPGRDFADSIPPGVFVCDFELVVCASTRHVKLLYICTQEAKKHMEGMREFAHTLQVIQEGYRCQYEPRFGLFLSGVRSTPHERSAPVTTLFITTMRRGQDAKLVWCFASNTD